MLFAAILAGGMGVRMNVSNMPKQFLDLGSRPVIVHTLEKFLLCKKFDYYYIGVHPDWILHMKDLVNKYCSYDAERIRVVAGGSSRSSTFINVVNAIENEFTESDEHILVTHDAVRPFVTLKVIEENIEVAQKYGACDTVIPATDTIVSSKDGEVIDHVPQREKLYQGQTPQSFNMKMIKELYNDLSEEERSLLTDVCSICVMRGKPVYLVKGNESNMKLTTIADYRIASSLMEEVSYD